MLEDETGGKVLCVACDVRNWDEVEAMKEAGIHISNQKSKELTDDMIRNSSNIVNMGCMEKESCPTLFLQNLLDWNIEDPKGKPIEKVREIRDQIDQRVKELAASIKIYQ